MVPIFIFQINHEAGFKLSESAQAKLGAGGTYCFCSFTANSVVLSITSSDLNIENNITILHWLPVKTGKSSLRVTVYGDNEALSSYRFKQLPESQISRSLPEAGV